jgi:DNA topoisomerase-3
MQYVCEKAVGPNKTCDFRTGKIILQRPIEREQVVKLLETGKTDLLHKFISKKGRPFSAFLVYDKEKQKVGFEFAPREPKAPKGKPKAKPAPVAPNPA